MVCEEPCNCVKCKTLCKLNRVVQIVQNSASIAKLCRVRKVFKIEQRKELCKIVQRGVNCAKLCRVCLFVKNVQNRAE